MSCPSLGVLAACLVVAGAAGATLRPDAGTAYIEAERFDDVGGWTIDAQFRQIMGSTYLLAAGIGEPVRDATTKVALPRAGRYRLWVRCKDWHPASSPGAFQVLVNGTPSATAFGTQKKGWAWVDGGHFELPAGQISLALHDQTGYYGRCDAVVLTLDAALRPPDDVAALAAFRARLLGETKPVRQSFHFVVVGAGYGGVCAAVQAARLGLRTALVQNRPCLGGNASKEVNVGPGGACPHTAKFRETGLCEEIAEGRVHKGSANWSDAIDLVVRDTPNLTVFLNTEGTRAVMDGAGHIAAVEAEHVATGQRFVFEAPLFADCTGDGAIAVTTGAAFRRGQEARSEFDESIAPEKANPHTMGTSLIHGSRRMPTPQPFVPPPFAVKFTAEHFTTRRHNLVGGTWWIEYGGLRDTIQDAEEIRDELIRVIFGAFDWAKNHDPATRDKVTHHRLVRVPTVGGKRESRRFIGDYTLTQHDVQNATVFPDRVAFGGWPIDLHPSPGIYGKDVPPARFTHLDRVYSIPYRILYTRDVDNLFLAGRHASVTHVALGSTRLMQTIGVMGQAVGAAAFLCRKHGVLPRGVYGSHIEELQQLLLRWDCFIPEVTHTDAADLCRGARMSASSSLPDGGYVAIGSAPKLDRDAPCTMDRGQGVVLAKPGQNRLTLYLRATGEGPVAAKLHIEEGALDGPKLRPLCVAEAQVRSDAFQWVPFTLPQPLEAGKPYFVWLPKTEGLCWKIFRGVGGGRVYGRYGAWTRVGGRYAMRPLGAPVALGTTGPEAAVDGVAWPIGGECHQWRSHPEKGLPQWIQADFPKAAPLDTVYLTFDTNIHGRFPSADAGAHVTARHYRLLYDADGAWQVAFEEKANWRRFRRHAFPTVTTGRIRLEILEARNGDEARLYSIRACRETAPGTQGR